MPPAPSGTPGTAPVPPKPEPAVMPCKEWMASAAAFLADCQRGLDCIPAAVVELCLHRGLTLDSAAAHGLGWNACDRYVPRAVWGLPGGKDKDGNPLYKAAASCRAGDLNAPPRWCRGAYGVLS